MSLYGSLYSSVAGLRSQSNKIGIISDNISNVNTIGYKQNQGQFETLVTNSGLVSDYSPGGVLALNRQLVSKQGLIQGTDNSTDVAITGKGFFVVNTAVDSTGNVQFTRAGSFRQDSLGNFRNASGFYLQGWPLDREGRLPGEPGNINTNSSSNITSLETVNIQQATGSAAQTTTVELSANLKASQVVLPGADATAAMDPNTDNVDRPAKSIIVPGVLDGTTLSDNVNSLQRGDKFLVTTGSGLSYTYRYGGFTYGRDVTSGANGDSGTAVLASPITLANVPFTTSLGSQTVTVTSLSAHGLQTGDVVTISGVGSTVNGIPASDLNQKFVVTKTGARTFTIDVSTTASLITAGTGGSSGLSAVSRPYAGNILDASTETQRLLGTTGTSGIRSDALSFTITTATTGTVTFSYTTSTPNAQLRQFNTLSNLADAINAVAGLTARVSGGRLFVGAADANEAITFANGSAVGDSGPPVKEGIDWVRELGLRSILVGDDRFNSLQSLASLINSSSGLDASISNSLTEATLRINVEDPLDTISFADLSVSAALTAFTSTTPFTTTNGSTAVTINHPSPHGFKTGDIVTLDPTGFTGYPSAVTATGKFATTNTSTTVVVSKAAHGFSNGQVIHIDPSQITGYPGGNIGGIPLTDFDGNFTVANVAAGTFEITVATAATSTVAAGGAGGTFVAGPTFNGVPYTDFNDTFEITVTGPSTYTVNVAHAATSSGSAGAAGLVVTPPNNSGSVLAELGLVDSLSGGAFVVQTLGPLGPEYDSTDSDKNMASGNITPQYSQNIRIYDSLGTGHDLKVTFVKVSVNTWAAEIFAATTSEVSSTFADGLLTSGTLTFNGDGSLRSVSTGLAAAVNIPWTSGAVQSAVTFNWGTAGEPFGTPGATVIGKTDGMTQFDAAYKINFANQNGASVGQLISVTFDEDGFVIANFNNGESQRLYKIPIADFSNPDQLEATTGNVFQQSANSGEPNLKEAGTNGAGTIQPSALESSTVDLSQELTDLIVAQRAYQANTKLITTADNLLEVLNNTIR